MFDWFSWVFVAFLVYFLGKAQYYRFNAKNLRGDKQAHFLEEKDRYMILFWILLVVFLGRETMLSG